MGPITPVAIVNTTAANTNLGKIRIRLFKATPIYWSFSFRRMYQDMVYTTEFPNANATIRILRTTLSRSTEMLYLGLNHSSEELHPYAE
jgi:hypothetical protein